MPKVIDQLLNENQNTMIKMQVANTSELLKMINEGQLDFALVEGYKKQEVTLGASNGKKVQILTGLKAGDRVVTKGAYQVKLASASNAIPAHSHEH